MDDENNQKQLTQEEVGELSRKRGNVEYFFCVLNKNSLFSNFYKEQSKEKKYIIDLKRKFAFSYFTFPSNRFLSSFLFYVDSIASFEKIRCQYCFLKS